MNHRGNLRLVGAGQGNRPGIDRPHGGQDRQQPAVTLIAPIRPTQAAVEIALAGFEQPLEALGPAQRIGPLQQRDESRRTQFGGAVEGPLVAALDSNDTPIARMSCAKTPPSWSLRTLPKKAPLPPSEAIPAIVFAAEPPELSVPGPIAP